MGKLAEFIKRTGNVLGSSNASPHEKLSPNEVELKSYEKREYLDNVKKKLGRYRSKYSMLNQEDGMLKTKQRALLKNDRKHSLFNKGKSMLKNSHRRERKLLNGRSGLW